LLGFPKATFRRRQPTLSSMEYGTGKWNNTCCWAVPASWMRHWIRPWRSKRRKRQPGQQRGCGMSLEYLLGGHLHLPSVAEMNDRYAGNAENPDISGGTADRKITSLYEEYPTDHLYCASTTDCPNSHTTRNSKTKILLEWQGHVRKVVVRSGSSGHLSPPTVWWFDAASLYSLFLLSYQCSQYRSVYKSEQCIYWLTLFPKSVTWQ
jgi:hypothetical protein